MRLKVFPALATFVLYVGGVEAYSQVVPSAHSSGNGPIPIQIGAGFSDFRTSFGHGTLQGGTIWIDYVPNQLPSSLYGLGIEVEARDLRIQSAPTLQVWQIDEGQAGLMYSWRHVKQIQPYAKALWGYGSIDRTLYRAKGHDSRTITVVGGGFEHSFARVIRTRVDYEYQFWPDFWKASTPWQALTPSGFTFGFLYDFGASSSH